METKMRIKLYSPEGVLESDRLVEQKTEFSVGPKNNHPGPISLEVNLRSAEELEVLIDYLRKLKGDLPITAKESSTKKNQTLEAMLKDKDPLRELMENALLKGTTQEKLVEFLRQYNFVFIASDILKEVQEEKPDMFSFKKEAHEDYQYLVRLIKLAKDPANDKYDFRLCFGIRIVGERVDKVLIYFWGKFKTFKEIPWENKKKINFKKVEKVYIFPDFMDHGDRKKWRLENRKLGLNPDLQPSKFYTKFKDYVKVV